MAGLDEREAVLRDAGLEVVGTTPDAGGLEPAAAWRQVIGVSVSPSVVVDDEQEDYLDEVDRRWRGLAEEHGVLAADGSFLVSVAGVGAFGLPWSVVRLTPVSRLSALVSNPGEPEFVTASPDGRVVCGVTTEEDGVWLVVRPATLDES
jgi:hypothetical protein